jgi:hypothetical protein
VKYGMPRTVKVMGMKVKVVFGKGKADEVAEVSHLGEWVHEADGFRLVGHASSRFGTIGIDSRQSEDQQVDTFVHENLHLMLMLTQADDEDLVFRFTPILIDWLRRNPRAVEYIMQKRLVSW